MPLKRNHGEINARRYPSDPSLIHPKLSKGGKLGALAFMARMMLTRVPNLDQWELERWFAQQQRRPSRKYQLDAFVY